MPTNTTDRIRTLLQQARNTADNLVSALGEIEVELADLEKEDQDRAAYYDGPGNQDPEITFTEEQAEIMHLKLLLNVHEAAFLLGVKPTEVNKLIREGKLPVCKIGRAVRIPVKQLKEYIKGEHAEEDERTCLNT